MKNKTFIVCLVGLPSAGKSSVINSLIGKRILQTGEERTTTDVFHIGQTNSFNLSEEKGKKKFFKYDLISDDDVSYEIIDLPGVSDSQDKKNEFDELTFSWIIKADIIIWVTDSKTAFLHSYEKDFFTKIQNKLENHTKNTGELHQLAIMLSKYEFIDKQTNINYTNNITRNNDGNDDEIVTGGIEETTIFDRANRVIKEYGELPILKFSSYSKIIFNQSSSNELKSIVTLRGSCPPNNFNKFEIKWGITDYFQKYNDALCLALCAHLLKCFSERKLDDVYKYCYTCGTMKNNNNWCNFCKAADKFIQCACSKPVCYLISGNYGSYSGNSISNCRCDKKFKCKSCGNSLYHYIDLLENKCHSCGKKECIIPYQESYFVCKYCASNSSTGSYPNRDCNSCGKKNCELTFDDFLNCIYYSKIDVNQKTIENILNKIISDTSLEHIILFFLANTYSEANEVFSKLSLDKHKLPDITDDMICNTLTKISETIEFKQYVFEKVYSRLLDNNIIEDYSQKYSSGKGTRFLRLFGKRSIHYERFYFSNIFGLTSDKDDLKLTFVNKTPDVTPEIAQYDSMLYMRKELILSSKFVEIIENIRLRLWGENNDENIMLILPLLLNGNIKSLFQKVDLSFSEIVFEDKKENNTDEKLNIENNDCVVERHDIINTDGKFTVLNTNKKKKSTCLRRPCRLCGGIGKGLHKR